MKLYVLIVGILSSSALIGMEDKKYSELTFIEKGQKNGIVYRVFLDRNKYKNIDYIKLKKGKGVSDLGTNGASEKWVRVVIKKTGKEWICWNDKGCHIRENEVRPIFNELKNNYNKNDYNK